MNYYETLKDKKWVVAVSGGADSMALLDMCYQNHFSIVVAHVNYKKRASAERDMQGVKAYCDKRQIACFIHIVDNYEKKQNFQAQARNIRYTFFKSIMEREKAQGVLVAHHMDDVLETYLMQIKRKNIPEYYGIKEETKIQAMSVKRILLDYTKKELIQYCVDHNIDYYEDESNLSDTYTRNKIRHEVIDHLSYEEKKKIELEIKEKNQQRDKIVTKLHTIVDKWEKEVDINNILDMDLSLQEEGLRMWILQNTSIKVVHNKNIKELISIIHHKKGNYKHNIKGHFNLVCEYEKLKIEKEEDIQYAYSLDNVKYLKTPYFEISNFGEVIEGITLKEEDFPIVIRNVQKGDKIKLRLGTKKINRFFIDNKISHKERRSWPLVVNYKGNVIFVCGIGCDIEHYSNNCTMFVLK